MNQFHQLPQELQNRIVRDIRTNGGEPNQTTLARLRTASKSMRNTVNKRAGGVVKIVKPTQKQRGAVEFVLFGLRFFLTKVQERTEIRRVRFSNADTRLAELARQIKLIDYGLNDDKEPAARFVVGRTSTGNDAPYTLSVHHRNASVIVVMSPKRRDGDNAGDAIHWWEVTQFRIEHAFDRASPDVKNYHHTYIASFRTVAGWKKQLSGTHEVAVGFGPGERFPETEMLESAMDKLTCYECRQVVDGQPTTSRAVRLSVGMQFARILSMVDPPGNMRNLRECSGPELTAFMAAHRETGNVLADSNYGVARPWSPQQALIPNMR